MTIVRYVEGKVLNRDDGIFAKTNAWKPLFEKIKTLR